MPRLKSDEKRSAILAAATRFIAAHGLSAPTAGIAKAAGVANGSLFTYFDTKTDLFNQLYLELKAELAAATVKGVRPAAVFRDELFHVWQNWTKWAVTHPEKRRTLAQLSVSDEITPESRAAAQQLMAGIGDLLERTLANASMRQAPRSFVVALMNATAEETITLMGQDTTQANAYCELGFNALWRILN